MEPQIPPQKKTLFLKVCVKAQHEPAVTVCYRCKVSDTGQGEGGKLVFV